MFKAHAPPPGACDNMIVALKILANLQEKENFTQVVYEGIMESSRRKVVAALRQFIEMHNHKALVQLLDQHWVGKEVVGPTLNKVDHKDSGEGPEEPTSRVGGERRGQKVFVDTTQTDSE